MAKEDLAQFVPENARVSKEMKAQMWWSPPYPNNVSYKDRIVIVTGANVGLGRHASMHFARLGAAKVIMACRSLSRGEAARKSIVDELAAAGTPPAKDVLEVWHLDLTSHASVKEFAQRVARELPRLDHAVLNASVAKMSFERAEGEEATITVNVVSTFLLALLLLPVLRKTAADGAAKKFHNVPFPPSMSIVGSGVAALSTLPQRNADNIFDALSNEKTAAMQERYPASKLLQAYAFREMAARMPLSASSDSTQPGVVLNMINPGFNKTELAREISGFRYIMMTVMKTLYAWEAEVGSRTLVHGTIAGPESHGNMLSNCSIWNDLLGDNVTGEHGQKTQKKVWAELVERLEKIEPGVTGVLN